MKSCKECKAFIYKNCLQQSNDILKLVCLLQLLVGLPQHVVGDTFGNF